LPAERGAELFDLPDAPRPPADTPAPPRFLPEFDNLLFAWRDRSRVISEEYRRRISVPPLQLPTFLLDGFVAGIWKIERSRDSAELVIEPFARVRATDEDALTREGERLLHFMEPEANETAVRFMRP
jgi:hypothetical protein